MTDDLSKRNRVNQTDLNLLIKKTKNVINSLLLAQAFHLGLSFPMDVGSSILEKGCALSASPLCPCLYMRFVRTFVRTLVTAAAVPFSAGGPPG